MEQVVDDEEYWRRFLELGDLLAGFDGLRARLFWSWFEHISSRALPETLRQELLEIKKNTKPGEVKTMISNMERNLKRYYEEAIVKGKTEGMKEGMKEGIKEGIKMGLQEGELKWRWEEKVETVMTMLQMNLDAKLIAAATRLPLEEVEKLKLKTESQK